MSDGQKTIYVYDSFSNDSDMLIGRLYADTIRGAESYSFEYDETWLGSANSGISLDPALMPYRGRQFSHDGGLFGMFADASPDRWGRMLINKNERRTADIESRRPRKLTDSDYLIAVYDKTRMGGLRFKTEPDGSYLSDDAKTPVPPLARLRSLEEAARNFENDDTNATDKWIDQLIRPGSSLGGARPKATVQDENGGLWIAKFPSKHDENDTGAWEKVVSDLAIKCELYVPESKLEKFSDYGSTFLIKRFDRKGERRIHFASAMTLLGKSDGASAADGTSYLDIAGFIRANGASPKEDLEELWKRMVFNMAVNNTDDHLRNHAFIFTKKGWRLSPAFDVNPVPYGDELSLNVSKDSNQIFIDLAIDVAPKFGIERGRAVKLSTEITKTVNSAWEPIARSYDLSRAQIENMRPAFSISH